MTVPVKQSTFAGGEIAPYLYGRTDLSIYEKALRTLRNMIPMRHGGVTGRPGTQYIGTSLNGGAAVRLIPFIFNETGLGQSYVLEFGNLYVAFYQNGGVVTSGGVPYTIVSPYAQADLANLKFAETADIITIVHPSYPIYELKRIAATNWTLTAVTSFGPSQNSPTSPTLAGTGGTSQLAYLITAVSANGIESSGDFNAPCIVTTQSGGAVTPPSAAAPITLTWTVPVGGAAYYRIYYSTAAKPAGTVIPSGNWGYIGSSAGTTFVDNGITPNYQVTAPLSGVALNSAGNYPSAVGFVQQRRVFANTNNNPVGCWMSQPGDFYNFDVSAVAQDSDAVAFSIAGEEVNAIQHVVELKFMLLLAAGSELFVQGNGSGTVTPSAINASAQSQYGCSSLRPLKVGDTLIFCQALGSAIRDFAFDFAIDGYRGNDISVFSAHLFENYQIVDWCYQKIPDSIIWAVRSDGVLLSCTYIREQQVLAWARHDFNNGFVENVCAIPENGQYSVYASIKRTINGSTVRYIERVSSRIWTDPLTATYLDCFLSYDGRNTGATTMTLTASGGFQTGTSAYTQQLTLTASVSYFTANMVGNVIVLQDASFVSSQGESGQQLRLTIQAYTSGTVVTVTPERVVPSEFQAVATTVWSRAVKSVTGLDHLKGQNVSVWADRYVVGSPLNYHVTTTYTVSNAGGLTLDKAYSVIYVGLPMIQDFEPLDFETSFGEAILAKRKIVKKLSAYLYKTRSFFVGSENPDTNLLNTTGKYLFEMFEERRGMSTDSYDEPGQLFTAQDYVISPSHWTRHGRFFVRNVDPVPLTILAVSPQGDTPGDVPMAKRV